MSKETKQPIKIVLVGDGAGGKTSMLITYTSNAFPDEYVPTVFDNYETTVEFEGTKFKLGLWDTVSRDGPAYENRMTQLSFPQTDVFFIVCPVTSPHAWEVSLPRWVELFTSSHKYLNLNNSKMLLVGSKIDLREDEEMKKNLKGKNLQIISNMRGKEYAQKYDLPYTECSSLTRQGLKEVFDMGMRLVLQNTTEKKNTKSRGRCVVC